MTDGRVRHPDREAARDESIDALLDRVVAAINRGHRVAAPEVAEQHFHDAQLLSPRAQTHTESEARAADLAAALELCRQGATLFELLSAHDDFVLRGEPARAALVDVVDYRTADSAFPEVA